MTSKSIYLKAFNEQYQLLVTSLKSSYLDLTDRLFSKSLLSDDIRDTIGSQTTGKTETERARILLDAVRDNISQNSDYFYQFLKVLKDSEVQIYENVANLLEHSLSNSSKPQDAKPIERQSTKKWNMCWKVLFAGVCLLLLVLVRNCVTWQHEDSGLTITLLISMDKSEPGSSVDIYADTVSHNLPRRSSPFFGRENNITYLTNLLLKQNRIININGPPAFGKSSLAIKLGWHLIENYSTVFKEVRYIDTATTKRSIYLCSNYQNEQSWPKQNTVKSVITTESQVPHESNVEPNLCEWFKTRKEKTLLILDNCDSFLQGSLEKQEFVDVINSQLDRCDNVHNKLSIVITSQEQLEFLDDCFQSFQITELDPADSVSMLRHHVPALNDEMAHNVSSLVGHCPLALKVVGRMLAARGIENMETLLQSLKDKIVSTISNRISDNKERFKAIMDLAYTNLDIESQECNLIVSLFSSTFELTIGNKILSGIVDPGCVQKITQKSFVEEYFIANKARYTMHKLIRSYFQEEHYNKNSFYVLKQRHFRANYITYYSNYLIAILKDRYKFKNITDEEVHKIFYLENENFEHFELALILTKHNLTDESVLALSLLIIEHISFFRGEHLVFQYYIDDHNLYIKLCQFSSTDICSRLLWRLLVFNHKLHGRTLEHHGTVTHFYLQLLSYIIQDTENIYNIYSCKNLTLLTYGDALSHISKHVEQSGSNDEKDLFSLIENTMFFCKNDWVVHKMRLATLVLVNRVLPLLPPLLLIVVTIMWLKVWFSFKESASIVTKHFLFFCFFYWFEDAHLRKLNTFIDIGKNLPHKFIDYITIVFVTFLFILKFVKIVKKYLLYKRRSVHVVLCFTNILVPTMFYTSSSRMDLYCFHVVTSLGLHVIWKYVVKKDTQRNETVREESEPLQYEENFFSDVIFSRLAIIVISVFAVMLVMVIAMTFFLPYYVIKALSWFSDPSISTMFDIGLPS